MKSLFLPLLGAASGGLFTTVNRVFFKSRHGKYLAAPPRAGCFVVLLVLVGLLAASVQADVVFTSLYSFTGTNDGANPEAGLVQGSDGYFYGTTYSGGTNNYGTIFKISTNGALTSLYSFALYDGTCPEAGLVQGSDGYFYGTTYGGGTNNNPNLIATNNYGTVFKISTSGALTSLYSFGSTHDTYHVLDGFNPSAPLVQGSDGYFYGTTYSGGTNNLGTVFKISTSGALTSLYSFTGFYDGARPAAGLVQGSDGYLYGTCEYGGESTGVYLPNGAGTVFKISTNGTITILYEFPITGDYYAPAGANPQAALVQGSDGYFYGTTYLGGYSSHTGNGTVFKISTNSIFVKLYDSFSTGARSAAGLVQGSDGNFYGTTYVGGTHGDGTVFKFGTNGALATLYSFSGTNDGANPRAALVQGSDGSFYGTTQNAGTNNLGTVFRLTVVPPQLAIVPAGANVILSWPTDYVGFTADFTLEFATNLVSPTIWQTNSTAPVVIGDQNVVTNPITGTQMFFRLTQ